MKEAAKPSAIQANPLGVAPTMNMKEFEKPSDGQGVPNRDVNKINRVEAVPGTKFARETFSGTPGLQNVKPKDKSAAGEFPGFQLSNQYDYKPDINSYAPQPPKAGVKANDDKKKDGDAPTEAKGIAEGFDAKDDEPDTYRKENQADISELKKRIFGAPDTEEEDMSGSGFGQSANMLKGEAGATKQGDSNKDLKDGALPAIGGAGQKKDQPLTMLEKLDPRAQMLRHQQNTRNILENNKKFEWEITDTKATIQKKINERQMLKEQTELLPAINNGRGQSNDRALGRYDQRDDSQSKHIQTTDKKIKIIGQQKPTGMQKNQNEYFPESVEAKVEEQKKQEAIPNAFERKKIREDIKIILDQNFNVVLNNRKMLKTTKLAPVAKDAIKNPEGDGTIQVIDTTFGEQAMRAKVERRVERRRSNSKNEAAKYFTSEEIKAQEIRDSEKKQANVKKEPGMVEMVREIPGDKETVDWDKEYYLDNKPSKPVDPYEPGTDDEVYLKHKKKIVSGEKYFVVVYFIVPGPDGAGWRNYTYDLFKEATQVIDLKIMVEKDFGYNYQHQHYFFNFKKIDDSVDLKRLEFKNDIWTRDCISLIMIPSQAPTFNRNANSRGRYKPIRVTDMFPEGGPFAKTTQEFLDSNVLKSLLFPPNRNWTEEFYMNFRQTRERLNTIKAKDQATVSKKYLGPNLSDDLTKLVIFTKGMQKTISEFENTAIKCVEIINKWSVKPHEINFLYGVSGPKWVLGGIVIKECKYMYTLGRKFEKNEVIGELLKHKVDMMNWVRMKTDSFVVPLCCAIEHFGRYYMAYAAVPVDLNSLVYGSITQNLMITTDINDNLDLVELVKAMNLNLHKVREIGTNTQKEIVGTSNWEIHRVKDKLYVTDIDRLLPLDFTEETEIKLETNFVCNFLPIEIVLSSTSKTLDDRYVNVMSRDTMKCKECGQYIADKEFYIYDRGNAATNDKDVYVCCISCYERKKDYNKLQFAASKLKKKKFRAISLGDFYVHKQTGELLEMIPHTKVPLNPDSIETKGMSGQEMNEVKNDRLNIKYLSNTLRSNKCQEIAEVVQKFEEDVGTCRDIAKLMKRRGVPARYLGKIAENSDKNFSKELVVREMIAVAMAHILMSSFEYLRRVVKETKEYNLKKNLACHLNNLMGAEDTEDSRLEWKTVMDYIKYLFDTLVEVNVKEKIHMPGLLIRILELVDAKLLVSLDDLDFSDPAPFKINFFKIYHPRVVYDNLDRLFHRLNVRLRFLHKPRQLLPEDRPI